jgi:hypothetical protein
MIGMGCHEASIQTATLLSEDSGDDFDSGITQHGDTATANFVKGVNSRNDYSRYMFINYQFSTRWSLTIVRTWFKSDIHRAVLQQFVILDRSDCVYLGMTCTAQAVPTFTDNLTFGINYHCAHHWIW